MEIKRRFINKKLMTGILATSMVLGATACSNNEDNTPETVIVYETVVVTATPAPTNTPVPTNTNTPTPKPTNTPTPRPTNTPIPTEEPKDKSTPPTEYHSADGGIDAFWDDVYNKINYINWKIDNIDYEEVKEDTINYAKDLIDFIFYGGEMNGMTFDELKDDAKQEIYAELQRIDSFIMEYIPDYKERIGEKYNLVKDFASTKLEEAKEIFNSHIDIDINVEKQNSKQKSLKLRK